MSEEGGRMCMAKGIIHMFYLAIYPSFKAIGCQ